MEPLPFLFRAGAKKGPETLTGEVCLALSHARTSAHMRNQVRDSRRRETRAGGRGRPRTLRAN